MDHTLFDWDDDNITHIAKHDVMPEEAEQALSVDPSDVDFDTYEQEERTSQLGRTTASRILVVVSTMRKHKIRIVTAFDATRRQQMIYFASRRLN